MITKTVADEMLSTACATAADLGVACSIAILDAGGNLQAFCRMDNATLGSVQGAQRKAFTSAASSRSTTVFFELANSNPTMATILGTGIEGFMLLPGGEPLSLDGAHLGGVGVAGGSGDQDKAIAEAAALVLGGKA